MPEDIVPGAVITTDEELEFTALRYANWQVGEETDAEQHCRQLAAEHLARLHWLRDTTLPDIT